MQDKEGDRLDRNTVSINVFVIWRLAAKKVNQIYSVIN